MMDEVLDKKVTKLDLSHNAFGPQGIATFEEFLSKANYLRHFDVSNCGLSPRGGEMIADALLMNQHMRLKTFSASRSRLEEKGIAKLSQVLYAQQSIEKLDLAQNGCKRGLAPLLKAMVKCSGTLKSLNIEDNKSINRAIPDLVNVIHSCKNLEYLNISDLNLKKKFANDVVSALLESLQSGSKIHTLVWNFDLVCSQSIA
jgi:Ran GTPase-activating protein (RanGAP) involved in mRNA processing and transport